MKILFILPEYYPHSGGGISTYYQHYIHALKPHCEHIKVIVGSGYVQGTDKFNHNGIEVEYLDPVLYQHYISKFNKFDLFPEYRNNVAAAWGMWHQSHEGKDFDIIECTDFGLGFIPWLIYQHQPVITRMHGSAGQIALHENSIESGLAVDAWMHTELALLALCNRLVTHSKANFNFWSSVLPLATISYIPPVYEPGMMSPVPFANRDHYGLIAARIQKWKGPAELCQALQEITLHMDIRWVGRDTAYDKHQTTNEYLSTAYPNIWNTKVVSYPPKPHAEIQHMQRQAKYGLVPSVWDMFNFTCVEFMAAGTPVICADGAGASELIVHGINGYTYPAANARALAECINLLAGLSEYSYNKMAAAAQQTAIDLLQSDAVIPANIALYTNVVTNFLPAEANVLLKNIYAPSDAKQSFTDVLDKQPLRKLVSYLTNRVRLKMMNK